MQDDLFYGIFALRLRGLLRKANLDLGKLQEVRLRCDRPLLLQYAGSEYGVTPEGTLTSHRAQPQWDEGEYGVTPEGILTSHGAQPRHDGNRFSLRLKETQETDMRRAVCVRRGELEETLEYVSGYSLYAFDEELKQGFLTVPGGHRIGVAGHLVMENGKIQCIRHISYINIRLSHQLQGCADAVMKYLVTEGSLCHTLIISPPRCGKTTLLRDLIRQISNGTRWLDGRTVGVVDERSELAGAYLGIAQNDLGMRTDVFEGGPKAAGIMMLLRSMSPQVIAVDEIGSSEDSCALENVFHCGCRLIATVHGTSLEDVKRKPLLRRMLEEQMFERYIILGGDPVGSVREILGGRGEQLYRKPVRESGAEK